MKKSLTCWLFGVFIWLCFGFAAEGQITFLQKENQIDVLVKGKLITSYRYGKELLKPCLYPLLSPSGEEVTRGYPFVHIKGESSDHPHHTGAYFGYGSKGEVNGSNFWYMEKVPPQIRHVEIKEMEGGQNKGKLSTISHWINQKDQPLLEERRTMVFSVFEDEYIIDFTIHLAAMDTTVTFQDTKEGMFAVRVSDWLAEDAKGTLYESTGEYMNAEGERTEENIWGKRSSWVRLEGEKAGKTIGIAIYHNPSSTNYPTYWHARGYGCFAANPIGQYDFQKGNHIDNPDSRSLELKSGEEGLFKFRMVIYEGKRTKAQLNRHFKDFGTP